LEREEVDAIVSACRAPRDTAIVLFLVDTGVRAGELLALNVGDVNTTRGTVVIRHGKGDKARTVCFGTKTRKALLKYLMTRQHTEADAPLWVIEDGSRLTYWALRDMLERLKGRCKVENCHPHAFRRTFALWSLRAGMDIYSLQMLMGHSSLRMLRQYLALVTADIEHAHQQHGPVDHTLGKR
jgi:site-specific recombinase XerD